MRKLASAMGYQPDLRIRSLMSSIRRGRVPSRKEPLAFIWMRTPKNKGKLVPYVAHFSEAVLEGARRRARQLGCTMEEFWLDDGLMRPDRLNRILQTRGIAGFVISTAASTEPVRLEWDWSPFAVAIIGHTEFFPPLHRSAHHHYLSMCSTLQRLKDEGWTRPAAILGSTVQCRIQNMQTAAFLANHPCPASAGELLRLCEPNHLSEIPAWSADASPDALILQWQADDDTVRALRQRAPSVRRIVTLDWYPDGILPGVDPTYGELAERAVDLVVEQLHNNERGVPARPRIMLFDGVWRERAG